MRLPRVLVLVGSLALPLAACGLPGGEGPLTLLVQHDETPGPTECVDGLCTVIEDITITNNTAFPTLGAPELVLNERADNDEGLGVIEDDCPDSLAPGDSCQAKVDITYRDVDGVTLVVEAGFHRGTLDYGGFPIPV